MKIKVGIVGATGYTGEELIKTLQYHPYVELSFATSNSHTGKKLLELFPSLSKWRNLSLIESKPESIGDVDVVFLCLPAGESFKFAKYAISQNIKVIDLGPDFRFLNPSNYQIWYNTEHTLPELLEKTVYGLPEFFRDKIKNAQIIANPGCYPTSILLGTLPLLIENVIEADCIISDSKSGMTGAGKTPSQRTHFVSANENINLYSPGRSHRHVGEIEEKLFLLTGKNTKVLFNPQTVPVNRGILSTIYCKLKENTDKNIVYNIYEHYYGNEPFVRLAKDFYPDLHIVQNTNYCYIHILQPESTQFLVIVSVIDNLGKGASKQAIQNFNIMFDLEETTCLI